MTNTPMTSREAFEQFVKSDYDHNANLKTENYETVVYKDDDVEIMWMAWQACEQQNQAVVAELVEALKWALCMRDDMCDVHFEDELNQIKALLAKVKGK